MVAGFCSHPPRSSGHHIVVHGSTNHTGHYQQERKQVGGKSPLFTRSYQTCYRILKYRNFVLVWPAFYWAPGTFGVFVVVEGTWVPPGPVLSGISGGGLFHPGVALVCHRDGSLHHSRDVPEEGVRVFSPWGESKVPGSLVRAGICLTEMASICSSLFYLTSIFKQFDNKD